MVYSCDLSIMGAAPAARTALGNCTPEAATPSSEPDAQHNLIAGNLWTNLCIVVALHALPQTLRYVVTAPLVECAFAKINSGTRLSALTNQMNRSGRQANAGGLPTSFSVSPPRHLFTALQLPALRHEVARGRG